MAIESVAIVFPEHLKAARAHAFPEPRLAPNYQLAPPIGCCASIESPPLPLSISCAPVENRLVVVPRVRRKKLSSPALPELREHREGGEQSPPREQRNGGPPCEWKESSRGCEPGGFNLAQHLVAAEGERQLLEPACDTAAPDRVGKQTREWHKHTEMVHYPQGPSETPLLPLLLLWTFVSLNYTREVGLLRVLLLLLLLLLLISKGINYAGPNHSFRVRGGDEWRL